jgi:hypothetical protein
MPEPIYAPTSAPATTPAPTPAPAKKKGMGAGLVLLALFCSLLLIVLLTVTLVVYVGRNAVFNGVSSISFSGLIGESVIGDAVDDVVSRINDKYNSGVGEGDILDVFNSSEIKSDLQGVLDGYVNAFLTGDTEGMLTESGVQNLLRKHQDTINGLTGSTLTPDQIEATSQEVMRVVNETMGEALGLGSGATERDVRRKVQGFRDDMPPVVRGALFIVSDDGFRALCIASGALALIILVLCFRRFRRGLRMVAVPALLVGLLALGLGVIPSMALDVIEGLVKDLPISLSGLRSLLGGYTTACYTAAAALGAAGILLIVLSLLGRKKRAA